VSRISQQERIIAMTILSAAGDGPTTSVSTEYLMTLYAPVDPPKAVDSTLVIYNVRVGSRNSSVLLHNFLELKALIAYLAH